MSSKPWGFRQFTPKLRFSRADRLGPGRTTTVGDRLGLHGDEPREVEPMGMSSNYRRGATARTILTGSSPRGA
eukprot:15039302-Heterocapsa_arctica.AAC.1